MLYEVITVRVFRVFLGWKKERRRMKASQFTDAQKAFIIKQGKSLNASISAAALFPNMIVHMTKIGEESGT